MSKEIRNVFLPLWIVMERNDGELGLVIRKAQVKNV